MRVTPSSYVPVTLTAITIYYSLRHERPADLPTFFMRTLVWAALSALVFVPVALLAWISRGWAGWREPLVAALALYTMFLGMRSYLRRVQPRIDHLFHRRKHDLDAAAARFAERVAVLHTAADLGRAVAAVLEDTLYARLCAFAVPPDPELAAKDPMLPWKIVYSAWGSVPPPDSGDPLLKRLESEPHVLTREAVAHGAVAEVRAQAERMFARYGAEALLSLVDQAGARVLGLMAVSSRAGGRLFTDLELDFVDRIRTHAAAALVQARLYDQLHRLRQELEEKVAARQQELARAAAGLESAQQMLVQQEKMSLLGLLVSGVAQDLLTAVERAHSAVPDLVAHLAALQVALDLCRDAAGEAARSELANREKEARLDYIRRDLGALVDAIAEGARRATAIAQDLRRFARADVATRQAADLHAGLESTLNLLRHEFKGDRVKVERDYDMEIPPLECYPGPLNQVFMNLLLNAAQAIEEQGTITIRTRRLDPERIEVIVRDTGKGIPRENLGRIFEPFFTTKGQGGRSGSGLGLAISYGIVERHGGRIVVDSEVGKGTEFRVLLPIRAPGPPLESRLPD
jgi:two-component system NtrC family sensor kinase